MNYRLMASLEGAMQAWIESECETADWVDSITPDDMAKYMAQAAGAVLSANEAGQIYAKREGLLKE